MRAQKKRTAGAFLLLLALLLALLAANLGIGSVRVSLPELISVLRTRGGVSTAARIVWTLRLPRLLAAALLGGALAVSGFLLQTFFANPIAGPFVLGISSGAKLTVALTLIAALSRGRVLGSGALIGAAFLGSMLAMGLDKRKLREMPASTTQVITRTLAQPMPEKLPMDQLWRFTMFWSSAKVTANSVTALPM